MADSRHVNFINSITGQPVSLVWRGAGTAIFLEVGDVDDDVKPPTGRHGVGIEWSWRIEEGHSILVGSFNNDEEIESVKDLLTGQLIESVGLFGEIPELCIKFSSGRRLVSFATANGGPEWSVRSDGTTIHFEAGRFVYEGE
jgi:hypothetical protein